MAQKTSKHPLGVAVASNPLLIDPHSVDLVNAALAHLSMSELATSLDMSLSAGTQADDDFWNPRGDDSAHPFRPYIVQNGVLQIPVQGVLLNNFSYQFGRWATGYQYIEKAFNRGLSDPAVKAIAMVYNSGGGEVAGCFELADKMFEARGTKPVRAFAADHAYSAAYALASTADEVVVTRSGGTGSVGVVTAHIDFSEALANEGIKVTFIYAGKHKVDGNPYQKLPEDVKDRIQGRIDRIYGVFTGSVARNRDMDEKAVRKTEALTFDAEDSVSNGFADRVGAFEEELAAFTDEVAEAGDEQMATDDKKKAPGSEEATTFTQEQMDAAVAAATEAATVAGATAERKRRDDIMGCDEAAKKPKAAEALANAGATVEMAKATLAGMPEEAMAPKTDAKKGESNPFAEAMSNSENPDVGANAGGDDDNEMDDDEAATMSIVTSLAAAQGKIPKRA